MASRTSLVRVGAAVLGVSTALMIGILPAAAGTAGSGQNSSDATTATVVGDGGIGAPVTMKLSPVEAKVVNRPTESTQGVVNMLQLVKDGSPVGGLVPAYCIDLTTSLKKHVTMQAGWWSSFIGRTGSEFHNNNKQINWILQNSYPSIKDLSKLSTTANLPDTISEADAISGTQAAIWHFSDDATLDTTDAHPDADLTGLYNYLIGSSNTGIDEGKVSLSPSQATGTIGKLVGPFTLKSNLTDLKLDISKLPSGVTVVDANGKQLSTDSLASGSKFYLTVAAGTTATTGSVYASGNSPSGLIFTADNSQQVIAAGNATVDTVATATWTQSGATTPTTPGTPTTKPTQPGLAYTGVSATGPIILGALLVAAGGLFLLVQRRLKRAA
ncbi:MAG TPA: thioester domain-containing protein [Pseudonocardiaceae bacterium]|nr:thioester domain-containing protein [Pseudonocardiaceae bacterium]